MGAPVMVREARSTPQNPASRPAMTKTETLYRLTSMPEISAATGLPPTA